MLAFPLPHTMMPTRRFPLPHPTAVGGWLGPAAPRTPILCPLHCPPAPGNWKSCCSHSHSTACCLGWTSAFRDYQLSGIWRAVSSAPLHCWHQQRAQKLFLPAPHGTGRRKNLISPPHHCLKSVQACSGTHTKEQPELPVCPLLPAPNPKMFSWGGAPDGATPAHRAMERWCLQTDIPVCPHGCFQKGVWMQEESCP